MLHSQFYSRILVDRGLDVRKCSELMSRRAGGSQPQRKTRFLGPAKAKSDAALPQAPGCRFSHDLRAAQAAQAKIGTWLSSGPCFRGEEVSARFAEMSHPRLWAVVCHSPTCSPPSTKSAADGLSVHKFEMLNRGPNQMVKRLGQLCHIRASHSAICLFSLAALKSPLQWSHLVL